MVAFIDLGCVLSRPFGLETYSLMARFELFALARPNLLKRVRRREYIVFAFFLLSSSEGDVVEHRLSSESSPLQRLAVFFGLFLSAHRIDRLFLDSHSYFASS